MIALRLRVQFVLNNGPDGDQQYYASFTKEQFSLITWLLEHVGPYREEPRKISQDKGQEYQRRTFLLPVEGRGWRIATGFRDEAPVDRYADANYNENGIPNGPYGDWLCVDDDAKALLIKRLGLTND